MIFAQKDINTEKNDKFIIVHGDRSYKYAKRKVFVNIKNVESY